MPFNANNVIDALRRSGRRPNSSLYWEAGALVENRASSLGEKTLDPVAREELERVVPILFLNSSNQRVTYQNLLQFIHHHVSAIGQSAERDDHNLCIFSSLLTAIEAIERDAVGMRIQLDQQMMDRFVQRITEA